MNNMELETDIEALDMEMGDVTIHYCPVIPNPEGEPTAELKTADIEGTIYEIADEEARTELENKVDKEEGKGLSENDYTDEDKAIVGGVTTALDGKVDKDGDKVLSDNNYSDEDKAIVVNTPTALDGKADKSNTYTKTETDNLLSAKANTSDLSTVATSGSYNDLSDTPNLSTVATSGDYNDLTNKPVIDDEISPTSTNAVQNKVIYNLLNDLLPEATETGNPISITNASGLNAKSLKVELEPIQDTSGGEPSPEHICPISGRTQTVVSVNNEDTTIPFNQTVYGGEVDVTSGGTSDELLDFNMTDLTWYKYTVSQTYGNLFVSEDFMNNNNIKVQPTNINHLLCSHFLAVENSTHNGQIGSDKEQPNCSIRINERKTVYVRLEGVANASEFMQKIQNGKLLAEAVTPTTINTPSNEISLLKGNNTLTADGEMELVYSKTPQ